jgi:hypothetical protein
MKIKEWMKEAQNKLEKEELGHLEVKKAKIQLQLKNITTGEIEIHEFDYIAKDAENLKLQEA